MTRPILFILILALAILACDIQAPGTALPTQIANETAEILPPVATGTALPTQNPTRVATVGNLWKSQIRLPMVNVRASMPQEDGTLGEVVGQLSVGNSVAIVQCIGNWCEIDQPFHGWIYWGCLEYNPNNLGCEAR